MKSKHVASISRRNAADSSCLCDHPLLSVRTGSRDYLSHRSLLLLRILFEKGPRTTTQIRAEMPTFESDGAFNSLVTRLRRMGLVEGSRGFGNKPHTFWLSNRGCFEFDQYRDYSLRFGDVQPFRGNGNSVASGPILAPPGAREARKRPPTLDELRRVLSGPKVAQEFRLLCRALAAWRYDAVDLAYWTLREALVVDSGNRGIPRRDATAKMSDALMAAIRAAIDFRKVGPLFESDNGRAFGRKLVAVYRRRAGNSPRWRLFERAINSARSGLDRPELAALLLSDFDPASGQLWTKAEGSLRAARPVSDKLRTVLKEAYEAALNRPLFRSMHGSRWTTSIISQTWRLHARQADIAPNVRFPGHATMRASLVDLVEADRESPIDGAMESTTPNEEPQFSDYFPPKAWRRAFDCSHSTFIRMKDKMRHRDHPTSGPKMVAFGIEELRLLKVAPPSSV